MIYYSLHELFKDQKRPHTSLEQSSVFLNFQTEGTPFYFVYARHKIQTSY